MQCIMSPATLMAARSPAGRVHGGRAMRQTAEFGVQLARVAEAVWSNPGCKQAKPEPASTPSELDLQDKRGG